MLLEGPRVLATAAESGAEILFVLRESGASTLSSLTDRLFRSGTEVTDVSPEAIKEFAETDNPQGILGVAREPCADLPVARNSAPTPTRLLVLDGVQDPGNAGTLVRAAAGLGVDRVFALDGTVDLWSPKAVRASAGFVFSIPIHQVDWTAARTWLGNAEVPLLVADAGGDDIRKWNACPENRRSDHWALLLGNETAGPREEVLSVAAGRLAIPLWPGVDSLNVAVAGAILIWALGPAEELAHEQLQ